MLSSSVNIWQSYLRKNGRLYFYSILYIETLERLLVMGSLGRQTTWHLPGGPVGPPSRWAATSNVEVGQTTYAVNRGRVAREGREGSEGQSHKKEETEGRSGTGEEAQGLSSGPLAQEGRGRALFGDFCRGPEFLVTPLLIRPICLLSQGQFEEPVCL